MANTNKYSEAARKAQIQTDEDYAGVISSLIRLTNDDVEKLFPEKPDKDKLMELLAIVNSGTNQNEKIVKLKENGEKFGVIMIKLLKLLA